MVSHWTLFRLDINVSSNTTNALRSATLVCFRMQQMTSTCAFTPHENLSRKSQAKQFLPKKKRKEKVGRRPRNCHEIATSRKILQNLSHMGLTGQAATRYDCDNKDYHLWQWYLPVLWWQNSWFQMTWAPPWSSGSAAWLVARSRSV